MSMITATTWIRRGVAAPLPSKCVFDEVEYQRIAELTRLQLDDANEDMMDTLESVPDNLNPKLDDKNESDSDISEHMDVSNEEDELKKYDLENYDDEQEMEQDNSDKSLSMFGNLRSLIYYESNADDPYITLPENEEEDEERQELQILPTDNLIIAAKVEDEVANLEIYVYEDEADNLYVHNDIMLPAIPICLEWLEFPVGKTDSENKSGTNFVAVGTLDPDIEIWDLDMIDSNRQHQNLLASSSADKTVKLWDLNTNKCAKSYSNHSDKVCSIQWHPVDSTVLLSGSYDRTVVAADMRAPESKVPIWGVESDVEAVKWDAHNPNFFYVTTEGGMVHYHDIRMAPSTPSSSKPVWLLQAHDKSVCAFDINPIIPGFMATGSSDKLVKLWNIQPSGPSMIVSRDLEVGKVFSTSFAPDQEVRFRLAVAGSKGSLQIWDTSNNSAVRNIFVDAVSRSTT